MNWLDSDDEETNDSGFGSDEDNCERVEENINRFEIHTHSNLPDWERIESKEDKIEIKQGENLVATYADELAEDIDPIWFLLVFPDCFTNGQGLLAKTVMVKRWLSYLIHIDGSPFQWNAFVCVDGDWIVRHGVNLAAYH